MKNKFFWLLVMVIVLALALAACGGGPGGGPAEESAAESSSDDTQDEAKPAEEEEAAPAEEEEAAPAEEGDPELAAELSVYNWDDYIDEELLDAYEEEYGVDIIYDTFASNEDLLAKLQAGATGYDVIVPSDYMVSQMIELGLLAEIDTAAMPNFANI